MSTDDQVTEGGVEGGKSEVPAYSAPAYSAPPSDYPGQVYQQGQGQGQGKVSPQYPNYAPQQQQQQSYPQQQYQQPQQYQQQPYPYQQQQQQQQNYGYTQQPYPQQNYGQPYGQPMYNASYPAQPYGYVQQPTQQFSQPTANVNTTIVVDNSVAPTNVARPYHQDLTCYAVLTCLFCCWLFGLCAIFAAFEANGLYARGDYAGAQRANHRAKSYMRVSIGITVAFWIIYIIAIASS